MKDGFQERASRKLHIQKSKNKQQPYKILLLLEKQLYLVKFLCYNYYIEIYKLRKQIADEIYNDIAKIIVFMEG